MATKKKIRKKSTKAKPKKSARKKTLVRKSSRPRKPAKRKSAAKTAGNRKASRKKQARKSSGHPSRPGFSSELDASRSGEQSGDLQGLSRSEAADSESVDELLEEGNAFEADAVSGVEDAENADEEEVHTHEVPEDDVPGEYLDED